MAKYRPSDSFGAAWVTHIRHILSPDQTLKNRVFFFFEGKPGKNHVIIFVLQKTIVTGVNSNQDPIWFVKIGGYMDFCVDRKS